MMLKNKICIIKYQTKALRGDFFFNVTLKLCQVKISFCITYEANHNVPF